MYSKKLDEATVELKKMGRLLAEEKRKTDELLYQMLPERVANQLRDGKKVEAGQPTGTVVSLQLIRLQLTVLQNYIMVSQYVCCHNYRETRSS